MVKRGVVAGYDLAAGSANRARVAGYAALSPT